MKPFCMGLPRRWGHTHTRDGGGVWDRGQALARHVIDDVENPEATTIGHLIVNEVERPAGVDPGFDHDRGADANSSPPGSALADRQPLVAAGYALGSSLRPRNCII